MVIGIDVGGTNTKIVGFNGTAIVSPMQVRANDPLASIYGAFGKYLSANSLSIEDVDRVKVTGVGASFLTGPLYNVPTDKIDEFRALGTGGLFLTGLDRVIVVSMGTGTAYVMAEPGECRHIGGTGVGGGTMQGLSSAMLNVRKIKDLVAMAGGGSLSNIDLTIGDITTDRLTGLPPETTAANFGNISDLASKSDMALGIINMVFQTIGMLAVFATRQCGVDVVALTGNLTNIPQAVEIFNKLERLWQVRFVIPQNAEYATAVGAAITL